MMGRTLRSSNLQPSKLPPSKHKSSTSVLNDKFGNAKESHPARNEVDRTILEDQTNKTPSPPKRARLRGKPADNESSIVSVTDDLVLSRQPKIVSVNNKKNGNDKEKVPEKEETSTTKRKACSGNIKPKYTNKIVKPTPTTLATGDCEAKIQESPRASARLKRTASLKENETDISAVAKVNKAVIQSRPLRRVNKEEILTSIDESSDSEEEHNSDSSTPHKKSENTPKKTPGFKVTTFYGNAKTCDSPSSSSEDKVLKSCVYKSKKGEEPLAIQPRSENERLALYEFEFDSSEEPKPKKKKRLPARPRPKPASKSKGGGKYLRKPKVVKHNIPSPQQNKKQVASAGRTIVPSMPSKQLIATKPIASVPNTPKQVVSVIQPAISKPVTPVKSPCKSMSSHDLPPLIHLFDDDMEPMPFAAATPTASPRSSRRVTNGSPKTGPIRFEYQEILKARERVTKNSLTPQVKAITRSFHQDLMDNTLPAEESTNESSRLRQTSIRSFLNVQNDDEGPVDDEGLFATGSRSAVEIVAPEETKQKTTNIPMVSSTPQRPGKTRPPLQTFLSPVMASPQSRMPPSRTRASPRKAMGTPEKVQPVMEAPRRSPRKMNSPVKDSPLPMPTRLSIGTLRAAIKNVPSVTPSAPINSEDFPSLEKTKEQPASPQRNFRQPARKSYERRARKAPMFMDLEEEDSDEQEESREEEELLFGNVAADESTSTLKHHTTKHHKKHKDNKTEENNKELDEWASRFNSQLEEIEHFTLAVEYKLGKPSLFNVKPVGK